MLYEIKSTATPDEIFTFLYARIPARVAEESVLKFVRAINSSGPDILVNRAIRKAMRGHVIEKEGK